jgi:translation initiation factor 3 subunit B
LELFRVKEKNYPIEAVELKGWLSTIKPFHTWIILTHDYPSYLFIEVCTQFAWEPKGSRFAMVTTNEPNAILPPGQLPKNNVEFFHVDAKKGIFRLMRKFASIVMCRYFKR